MPIVSVIMNIRNGASTLREAVDSVLAQTFTDWELIVWDDRSTDASARVVAQYSDPRIRYFLSPEDTSLGKARDHAIREARGNWLAFLDQDDLWMPEKLEMQMALAGEPTGIIYGRTVRFYPGGRERDYDHAHEFTPLPEGDIFTQLFTKGCFIAMSSAVFHRSAVEEIGGIPGDVAIIPDYYLYAAVAHRHPVRAVQEVVCHYRMHDANMSGLTAIAMHQEAAPTGGSLVHFAGSADRRTLPQATLHRHRAGGDANSEHCHSWSRPPAAGWFAHVATEAAVPVRTPGRSTNHAAALLEDIGHSLSWPARL